MDLQSRSDRDCMTPALKKKMDEAFQIEVERASKCCDTCRYRCLNSQIYFEYGFTAAVEEMEKMNQGAREFSVDAKALEPVDLNELREVKE